MFINGGHVINQLVARDIYKTYGQEADRALVLNGVSASFEQGKTYAITGVSGSGKSTFLHILGGLDEPTSGIVLYNNDPLVQMDTQSRSLFLNQTIGLVFQYPYLIRELTVLENVMLKGLIGGVTYDTVLEKAMRLLEQVGLKDKAKAMPGQLSGGQQQRVAIARALISQPVFLLADEPTGALDMKTGTSIVELILALQKEWGMGFIVSTHEHYVYSRMEKQLNVEGGSVTEVR